eukprot:365578-Chlamydomonas_euryale.AAC.8
MEQNCRTRQRKSLLQGCAVSWPRKRTRRHGLGLQQRQRAGRGGQTAQQCSTLQYSCTKTRSLRCTVLVFVIDKICDLGTGAAIQMEKDKPKLALDKEQDRFHCEAVALKIFSNADKVDRAGKATIATAKAFLAASYFLDVRPDQTDLAHAAPSQVLNHFDSVDADILEKQKWAFWRAAEIRKAVREGRPPLPPAGDERQSSAGLDDLPMAGSATISMPSMSASITASEMSVSQSLPTEPVFPTGMSEVPSDPPMDDVGLPAAPAVPPGAPVSSGGSQSDKQQRAPGPPRFRPGSKVCASAAMRRFSKALRMCGMCLHANAVSLLLPVVKSEQTCLTFNPRHACMLAQWPLELIQTPELLTL